MKNNNQKVGLNSLSNRLSALNDSIPLDWLNNSKDTFKIKCKKLFLMLIPILKRLHTIENDDKDTKLSVGLTFLEFVMDAMRPVT